MKIRLLAALALTAAPLLAQPLAAADTTDVSALIRDNGLIAARDMLAALEDPSPEQQMGLAATSFLAGIEGAYQARWRIGATGMIAPLPALSTELPTNADPQPLTDRYLNDLAENLASAMEATRDHIPAEVPADAGLVLRLADLWIDIDANGQRGPAEGLVAMVSDTLGLGGIRWDDQGNELPPIDLAGAEVRFDAADLHWLRAYSHLIAAGAEGVLAFDPAPEIARMIALRQGLAAQWQTSAQAGGEPGMGAMMAMEYGGMADMIAATLATLRHQPDPARVGKTVTHLRNMIAANRDFWTAVALETDNDREWIPNDRQQAALGFSLPAGTGEAWLNVLADGEKLLDGKLLIPFWRFAPGHGIDLSSWLADPAPVDVIGWLQGTEALPHAKAGQLINADSLRQFEALVGGNAGLYMVLLN
ncbi:hypothetical protein ACEYYB_13575 [Paracoccus sp. p4-l81]|uniref:hypothetical protein n=1 Tax=unclassified Paracoccus (in: a-proteobacteria) TaxID=2688777 RepID=UPI0035B8402D